MKFSEIILENRLDDFKSTFGKKYSSEQIRRIIDLIPQKFFLWVGKNLDVINFDENFPILKKMLDRFEKISSNLPKTDLNEYKSLTELNDAIKTYDEKTRRNFRKVDGGNVVFENDRFFVVNPLTHESSCYYGKGTKWCTAADSNHQFNQYNQDGKLFYILDKTLPSNDPFYKVALLKKFDGDTTYYDALDEKILSKRWDIPDDVLVKLVQEIDDYLEIEYEEQLKIWRDKDLAKKEKDRLSKLTLERILREKRNDAEERRSDGEWTLGPECPEEGLKAHALLECLVINGNASVIDKEERNEILRLQTEINRLESDQQENDNLELSNEISELESEIEEIKEGKIDVYNIIPTGTHYDMKEFEVIDSQVDGNRYAVGTGSEVETSSYDYVENLIDDIGYEGFNSSFAKDYIDYEAVSSYAEDVYYDDVSSNPEVYFDENERLLSSKQEEELEILRMRISQTERLISNLEDQYDDENDEMLDEKIEELNDLIGEYIDEITDIEDSPSGDFPQDMIDEKVSELVQDVKKDPESFMSEFGLEWSEYVNKDEFIQGVIDTDGYGNTLGSYDGTVDEIRIQNELFFVFRID